MLLSPVVDRLKAQCPGLRQVLLALEGAQPGGYPAAYVLPLAEDAEHDELLEAHAQRITVRFGVELMVKHAAQAASGGPAHETLEALRDEIKAALAGWEPGAGFTPVDFAAGRLMDFAGGIAVWRDEFTTAHYLEDL
jgi:hypothetical protein